MSATASDGGTSGTSVETGTVLSLTALWVADLDRSVNFYIGALGFTEGTRFTGQGFEAAVVRAGTGGLELMVPTGDDAEPRREYGTMFNKIVLSVDDVETRLSAAADHGGEVAMPATPIEQFGLVIGMIRDPDGYLVEITRKLDQ